MLPELNSGGVECTVVELSAALVAAGHESIVISGGGRMGDEITRSGGRSVLMPVGKKSLKTFFLVGKLRRFFEEERPDIVHLHSRVPAWVALLAWRRIIPEQRPHLISTVHGFYSVSRYSAVMTCGEKVTAVSESARRYVLENYPSVRARSEKVIAIPLGVDPAVYHPAYKPEASWTEAWHASYPELVGKWVLCLPGRLTGIKGHFDFLKILKALKEKGLPVHGLIVGEARKNKKAYEESVRREVAQSGLAEHVTFTGHRDDLRDILSLSDVVLSLTTVPESFGRTTLESLALGRPTLGYAHGGVEEQLDYFLPEGKVPLRDIDYAVDLLARWYESPPRLPEKVLPPYRLQDMTDSYLNLYQDVASSNK